MQVYRPEAQVDAVFSPLPPQPRCRGLETALIAVTYPPGWMGIDGYQGATQIHKRRAVDP